MSLTREFVNSLPVGHPDKEECTRVVNNYLKNDEWNMKALLPVGVLLTSHPGNRGFLRASLESHKKLGYWISLVYDNYLNPERQDYDYNHFFPARDLMDLCDNFLLSHYQTWGGVLYPYFWSLYLGIHAMSSFKYIYCANGDCILEKPENFQQIIDMLGDGDILGVGWEENGGRPIFNTTGFLAKTEAAIAIINHFRDRLIPLDNYEKYTNEVGNTEGRFAVAIRDLGLNLKLAPVNPYNTQLHIAGGSWYDIIGFRHIHGEYNYAYRYKSIPPHYKYLDQKQISAGEYNLVKLYHDTTDPIEKDKILKQWWPKD
jgi:hypothetical protein